MQLPNSDELEIGFLSRLFDNKSECYKLFWFQAIVNKAVEGKTVIFYDELINEMITDAWYMVTEYHLNLGPADTLEMLVNHIFSTSKIKSSEKKENLISYLQNCEDQEVKRMKRTLTYHVPYRLQAPFLPLKGSEWNVSEKNLAAKINQHRRLMYYFIEISGMSSAIEIQPEWYSYIVRNQEILKGWIGHNLILYLQKRNPGVPGIPDKLYPPRERNLDKVKKYWKAILSISPVSEIFEGERLEINDMAIDHFIPWSYVAHDELWNLHPTTKSINSRKSNYLPEWNRYFPSLCALEYEACQLVWKYDNIHDIFEKCMKEHISIGSVKMKLYYENISKEEFSRNLEEIMFPVYQSARNMGFRDWI